MPGKQCQTATAPNRDGQGHGWSQRHVEGDDRHFAFERALIGRQMRLFVGHAVEVADLVELRLG